MMAERAEFALALIAGSFSIFLLVWHQAQGPSADWVPGFLAVFWSLLMMMRLLGLSAPVPQAAQTAGLAQKIIANLYRAREDMARRTLESSLGGSYAAFAAGLFVFALWQVYCVFAYPQNDLPAAQQIEAFFVGSGAAPAFAAERFFAWGRGFMLLLSFLMMGFVFRSHAPQKAITRSALLIAAGYAAAGYITYAGLGNGVRGIMPPDAVGGGRGVIPYLGVQSDAAPLAAFDILLLESGLVGLMMLVFCAFVPLGFISLAARRRDVDALVVFCGLLCGIVFILSLFLPFTAGLAGVMVLCAIGVFLSWGACESALDYSA